MPLNWDDLSILAAIRDTGTYAGAGHHLRLDETTISRRLARIQQQLKAPLFEAVDGRRRPTAYCRKVLEQVDKMARLADTINRINPMPGHPLGHIRLAATPSIAETILAPELPEFLIDNPGITIEVTTGNDNVDFSRCEADLAIRLGKPEKGAFQISKLADIPLYLFKPKKMATTPLVCCYPDNLDQTPEWRMLHDLGLASDTRMVTANISLIKSIIRSQKGIGILPHYMADDLLQDPSLDAECLETHREAWLLLQPHLKQDLATRLAINWIRRCFGEMEKRAKSAPSIKPPP
jgi:DNA-binding transcriptional LysR family regulator